MFKSILKAIAISILAISISNAEPINVSNNVKGVDVLIKSTNSLVVGSNDFVVTLSKNGKSINDAMVKVKFFMPSMPGMPYMESVVKAKSANGKYILSINLSMGGTWQYQLRFKTSDGKKYKLKGSVNL